MTEQFEVFLRYTEFMLALVIFLVQEIVNSEKYSLGVILINLAITGSFQTTGFLGLVVNSQID